MNRIYILLVLIPSIFFVAQKNLSKIVWTTSCQTRLRAWHDYPQVVEWKDSLPAEYEQIAGDLTVGCRINLHAECQQIAEDPTAEYRQDLIADCLLEDPTVD